MYRDALFVSFLILLFGNHQTNADHTEDAKVALAIVHEAMADLSIVIDVFNGKKVIPIEDLKKRVDQILANVNAYHVPPNAINKKELSSSQYKFYVSADAYKEMKEEGLRKMLNGVINIIQYRESSNQTEVELAEKWTQQINNGYEHTVKLIGEKLENNTAPHKELLKVVSDGISTEIPCSRSSIQSRIYRLHYDALLTIEIQLLLNLEFVLALSSKNHEHQKDELINKWEKEFLDRITETSREISRTVNTLSREVPGCVKREHKLDVTYTKLDPIFTNYLISKFDMLYSFSGLIAESNRDIFWYTDRCLGAVQKDRKCRGELLECGNKTLADIYVCPAAKDKPYRYEYWRRDDIWEPATSSGKKCPTEEFYLYNNLQSIGCHYTNCTCEDGADDIVRHFSLSNVTSDVKDNKIVTGVRIKKENYTIHLEIQQGKILKNGAVDQSTVDWKPIAVLNPIDPIAKQYRDFVTIRHDQRTVCLDNLDAKQNNVTKSNHVLTGVRFTVRNSTGNESYIQLEIQLTPYNLLTGLLDARKSIWLGNEEVKKHGNLVVSLDTPNHVDQSCVSFSRSSLSYDLGQSVIPQISLHQIAPSPAVPLSGVGLFYNKNAIIKGEPPGGVLGIGKVFTFDSSVRS